MSRRASADTTARSSFAAAEEDTEKAAPLSPPGKPRPFSHSWKDPEIAGPKADFIKGLVASTILTLLVVLAVLSIYWGAFWKAPDHIHGLNVQIVDLDEGAIGAGLRALFSSPAVTGAAQQLTYTMTEPGRFSTLDEVRTFVVDENAWAAVVVSSGATAALQAAVSNADSSWNASNVITYFSNTARNENATPRFITPQLIAVLERFVQQFALGQLQGTSQLANFGTIITSAPQLVARPVGWHQEELRPFDVPVGAAIDFVGLIYLLIIAFLVALMNFAIRTGTGLNTLLNLRTLLIVRFIVPFTLYFFMSWIYSFISLAFQVPFSRYYGHGGFVIYWASSFLGMCALGLAVEALITVLTPRFIPYFLLLWIVSNVSVAFFPLQLLPGVFKYGYAMPFYNVGQLVRTLVFNTKNHLGLNFGILFAWAALSCCTMAALTIITRRGEVAAARAKAGSDSPRTGPAAAVSSP